MRMRKHIEIRRILKKLFWFVKRQKRRKCFPNKSYTNKSHFSQWFIILYNVLDIEIGTGKINEKSCKVQK